MTRELRLAQVTEAFASLALEGMYPTPQDISDALEYIDGRVTIEESIAQLKAKYGITT